MIHSILYFILGTIFGSFLNVIIYRLPNSISIIFPRSHCTKCKKIIPFYLNIPIISYLILLGKCKYCKKNISFQYPFVEIISGIIFVYSFNILSFPNSLFFTIISSLLVCIAIIDYQYYIISLILTSILLIILIPYTFIYSNIIYHIYGMMIGFSYLLFVFGFTWLITKKQPLGYGDLILIVVLGLWLGPFKVLITIFLSATSGLLYWVILTVFKGYEKNKKLPLGTFLAITSIIVYCIQINWDLFN